MTLQTLHCLQHWRPARPPTRGPGFVFFSPSVSKSNHGLLDAFATLSLLRLFNQTNCSLFAPLTCMSQIICSGLICRPWQGLGLFCHACPEQTVKLQQHKDLNKHHTLTDSSVSSFQRGFTCILSYFLYCGLPVYYKYRSAKAWISVKIWDCLKSDF